MMEGITFANPAFLYLLLLIPLLLIWHFTFKRKRRNTVRISSLESMAGYKKGIRHSFAWLPLVLRCTAIAFIVIAIARPQSSSEGQNIESEGIAIVLAMDISGSMLAEDFKPNRIEAAKQVAWDFISARRNDLIGLVVFAGESFTQCPITTDQSVLLNVLAKVKSGLLEEGTAIGEGLGTAIARLKDSDAKSKVVILLTDGVNNSGSIAPLTAGEIARTFGIRVYTIGVGSRGTAPYPFKTPFGTQYQNMEVNIDEDVLQQISEATDAKYFRATSNTKLKEIYAEIDKLEKTKIEVTHFKRYTEKYLKFALIGTVLFLTEILLRLLLFRTLP